MLSPTKAIVTAPAISSALAISSAPARSSAPAGPSERKSPSTWESPDPTSRTPESTQHSSHWPPWLFPNGWLHVYPERAGIPELEGGCHSSLGSSGDISISHSGVSRNHRNDLIASVNHYYTTTPDSSRLRGPSNRTPSAQMGPFHQDPLLTRTCWTAPLLRIPGLYHFTVGLYTITWQN